jgi:uncharacterized membrane protein
VWVTRLGRVAQALVAVSIPGSIARKFFHHWLVMLYLFEAFVIAGGALASITSLRNFGLGALAFTALVHLVNLMLTSAMARWRQRGWWRGWQMGLMALGLLVLGGLLVLAGVGAEVVLHQGLPALARGARWLQQAGQQVLGGLR